VAREVQGDTYNYYTYNYYGEEYDGTSQYMQAGDAIEPVDHTTFADVREKLANQAAEPNEPTLADSYFEEAVQAFEQGTYEVAVGKFADAMELAPDDMVLPFAYSQALLANGQYAEAAEVLRNALAGISLEEEKGVFYPRGLYADEETLLQQIEELTEQATLESANLDLQLLLGYQLLGIGDVDKALDPLRRAMGDARNVAAAEVLIGLAQEIQAGSAEADND
jgi:tetratricopeptide (TPR) repeat protein